MKNSPDSCLAGKIFIHLSNIVLWAVMALVAFAVIFIPKTPDKQIICFLVLMGLIVDFVFMASVEAPVLRNPFKKVVPVQATVQFKEHEAPEKGKADSEFNSSLMKVAKVNDESSVDLSMFD